jgi:hypothetical protein
MPSAYRQKLERALDLTDEAGISRAQAFPPLLRGLSRIGLPVRPLHFMSVVGLVLFLTLGLGFLFVLFHSIAASLDVNAWALNKLRDLGQSGVISVAVTISLVTAIVIRYQALRADLPPWHEL